MTGLDPYDAGTPADSWRQQPNGPVYCTELTIEELPAALAAADRVKDAAIRDSLPERFAALPANPTVDDVGDEPRRPPLSHPTPGLRVTQFFAVAAEGKKAPPKR
ncbi:hypothetical protein [Streptomyces sp. NBC_00986]|uniref:hypothetical protein n=1 Tax=Streptomyces sp. NBC_00986 TaxID=2903702 RepID=UPI003869A9F8|nr:hypothetical protein OG504_01390 [Streptomyces sp. NBC_00986]